MDVNVSNLKHELSLTAPNLVEVSLGKGGHGGLFRALIHFSNPFR